MKIEDARKRLCVFDILAPGTLDSHCIADRCMAWRWDDWESQDDGYCGLAGKELVK